MALGKAVLTSASLLSISEHEQSMIQSTRTCLEVLIDMLSNFNMISTGQSNESFLGIIELKVQQLKLGTSELLSITNTVHYGTFDTGIMYDCHNIVSY